MVLSHCAACGLLSGPQVDLLFFFFFTYLLADVEESLFGLLLTVTTMVEKVAY